MNAFELSAILTLDSSKYEQGLQQAQSGASGFASAVGGGIGKALSLGTKAIGAASAAVVAFGASSVKTGMEFDKSMSQVYATMGDKANEMVEYNGKTVSSMEALRDFAQEMGAKTAFSASQSADALNYMALAGYDAETSMNMLPNVLNLAAAGNMDLARASDMVTDTQTAFGISLERTSQMVDEMAKASSTGNTSVEQLGDAFLVVGGLAQELNGGLVTLADGTQAPVDGIQEMEIAMTAMANAGIKGSEAGTHMRNMITKLSSPTADGAKRLEEMGVSAFDAQGKMRSLSDIFGDLNKSMSTMTQQEKIQAISELFNTRDLASAEALLEAVGDDWDKIGESILDSNGAAEEMANTQLDNLAGDVTIFKSALEGVQIALSDKITPALRNFVKIGTEGMSELASAIKDGDMQGAMDALSGIIENVLQSIVEGLPQVVTAGVQLLGALASGIIANLPALGDAVTTILQYFGNMFMENAEAMGETALSLLTSLADGIQENLPIWLETALSLIQSLGEGIVEAFPEMANLGFEIISYLFNLVMDNAPNLIASGLDIVANIALGILNNLPTLITSGGALLNNLLSSFLDRLPEFLEKGGQFVVRMAIGVMQKMPQIISSMTTVMSNLIATIMQKMPEILSKGVQIIGQLAKGLIQNAPAVLSAIASSMIQLIARIAQELPNFLQKGIELLGQVAAGIVEAIPDLIGKIPGILSDIASQFTSYDWASIGSNIINGVRDGVVNAAGNLLDAARNAVTNALNAAKNAIGIKSPSKKFRDEVGKMIGLGMALGIDDSVPYVTSAMNDLADSTLDGFDDMDFGTESIVTTSGSKNKNEYDQSQIMYALETIASAVMYMDETMADKMSEAVSSMKLEISGREFGRLVRDVRTA